MSTLVDGTDRAAHDTVVPAHGCIIWCAAGQSCSPTATCTGPSWCIADAMAACSLLADAVGVAECISSTPKIVSAISNPAAEAMPWRRRRITRCMSPTIARYTP